MNTVNFIPEDEYARVLEVVPVLCVDVMLFNRRGECLLVKRTNEPLKGQWWVIGGRVHKGENLSQAAIRKIREESGLSVGSVEPVGYYEETSLVNRFGSPTPLHTVSVVFTAAIDDSASIKLDDQSSEWKYSALIPDNFHIKPFSGQYPKKAIKPLET